MDSEKDFVATQDDPGGRKDAGADFIDISPAELFFNSTESLDRLCDHVANGGNLLDFAKLHRISYSAIKRWLNSEKKFLAAFEEAKAMQSEVIEEKILRELQRIGQFDLRSIFGNDNCVLPPDEWSEEAGSVIAGFEVHELFESDGEGGKNLIGYVKKIKLWDKTKTLESVAKIKQMLGTARKDASANENDILNIVNRMITKRQALLGTQQKAVKPGADRASLDSGSRGSAAEPVEIEVKARAVTEEPLEHFGEL